MVDEETLIVALPCEEAEKKREETTKETSTKKENL
jgi:hypothetical protein